MAVIRQRRLTIRGVGTRPVFRGDGKVAEGKALIAVRDGDVVLEELGVPRPEGGVLRLRAEFQWPLGTVALKVTPPGWSPGAYQR